MDNHICKICNKPIPAENHFWRSHHIKQLDYYLQYEPKYSIATNELIKFKSKEFYFNNDFNGRKEMMDWLKKQSNPQEHILKFFKKRKEYKQLTHAPSQVELKSIILPPIHFVKKYFSNYNEMCSSIGLLPRFDLEDEDIKFNDIKKDAKIVVDTREQRPFDFTGYDTVYKGLSYGDYALQPNKFKVYIERKEFKDFIGTLGGNFDRFSREIERAKKDKAYLVVVIEGSFSDLLSFDHIPHIKRVTKVTPDFVTHNMRTAMQKYNNIQFLFANNKQNARDMLLKIFSMTRHPKHFDLEYYKDIGKL